MGVQHPEASSQLPVHGFVLAGGKSSRMGVDKAMAPFCGRPLVEIAVSKLRSFCAAVSIAGNRDDLERFAPVVHERRLDCGPGAGVEAGLAACTQPWALFIPVDVPLVPVEVLRRWCTEALRVNTNVSYLGIVATQPVFCLLRCEGIGSLTRSMDGGEHRLKLLLEDAAQAQGAAARVFDEVDLYEDPEHRGPDGPTLQQWFANLNTPEEFAQAERDCKGEISHE